ncbi:MAG: hypothetical protein NVSMB46_02430 [Candidatus Saccharimonadales bacterium]
MKIAAISAVVLASALTLVISTHKAQAASVQSPNNTETQLTAPSQNVMVIEGDYLTEIAASHGTTMPRMYDANTQIKDPNLVYPGQILRIPNQDEQLPSRALPSVSDETTTVATTTALSSPVVAQVPTRQYDAPAVQAERPQPIAIAPSLANGSVWDRIANCESSGNWAINTGNSFYGGLQFTLSSWQAVGGSGYPNQASREEQIARAQILQSRQGWNAWPACSRKLGLL